MLPLSAVWSEGVKLGALRENTPVLFLTFSICLGRQWGVKLLSAATPTCMAQYSFLKSCSITDDKSCIGQQQVSWHTFASSDVLHSFILTSVALCFLTWFKWNCVSVLHLVQLEDEEENKWVLIIVFPGCLRIPNTEMTWLDFGGQRPRSLWTNKLILYNISHIGSWTREESMFQHSELLCSNIHI